MRAGPALVALALVLTACGGGDATPERAEPGTTGAPATGADPVPPSTAGAPALAWSSCGDAECATLAVPLDHDDPDGPTVDLAVLRLPARGDRIGSLLVNFGGPGSSAVATAPGFGWPDEVRDRFDVVAVDPRGVGGSTPLDCGVPASELYAVDHSVEDAADRQALLAVSKAFAADCERERAELLPHLGTRDVARDLDLVRAALGDEQVSYLGYSYGTALGQVYAELFPGRVRAMVLDGIVDPAVGGMDVALQQAAGFEVALARWAAACDARSTCPGADPVGAVDRALAAAESGVPAGDRTLGPGQATVGMAMALYSEALWPTLDVAVGGVLDGDGAALLALADQYATLVDFSAYFAVSCLDSTWPSDVDDHLTAAADAGIVSPRFGEALVNDYLRCTVWPVAPEPLGGVGAEGAPPVLLVSTTGDPATPHEGALAVAGRLAGAALLTREGEGHTITFQGDGCVDDVVLRFLVDGERPAPGARC